nr:phospholipase-like protein [Tanacetum cinerariifolium]
MSVSEARVSGYQLNIDKEANFQQIMDKEASPLTVMIKAKIDVVKEIREALTPTQVEIFEETCFGHWLGGSYIWEYTYSQLRDALHKRKVLHDAKREKGEKVQYPMTGFVWAFMIWILEVIPAIHCYVHKQPTEKILRALAWELRIPFSWSRCKHVQSEVVSEPLEIEKDGISEKKRKRGSSQSSLQDPTYDQLMITVTKLEGTVATLTDTVSNLHGTIGTLESQLLALEGDARVSTLTQTVSSLQGTISTLESRLHALEKSLPLANWRKLRARRTPLKLKSPMRCYSHKFRCTIPPPASTTMPPVTTISIPMTTTKPLKDTKDAAKDVAKDAAKDTHLDAVTTMSVPMTTTENGHWEVDDKHHCVFKNVVTFSYPNPCIQIVQYELKLSPPSINIESDAGTPLDGFD